MFWGTLGVTSESVGAWDSWVLESRPWATGYGMAYVGQQQQQQYKGQWCGTFLPFTG